jgi:hypothetical protein
MFKYPTTGIADCCARAGSVQVTAAPPNAAMNSRRLMLDMRTSSPIIWRRCDGTQSTKRRLTLGFAAR